MGYTIAFESDVSKVVDKKYLCKAICENIELINDIRAYIKQHEPGWTVHLIYELGNIVYHTLETILYPDECLPVEHSKDHIFV